jgi:photosystem II stability/assembly factor-like uncharacterized protein
MNTRFAGIIVAVPLSLSILGLLFTTLSAQAATGTKVASNNVTLRADPTGWENLELCGAHVNSVAFGPIDGGVYPIYMAANGGYYKSVDSGQTWTQMRDGGGQAVAAGRSSRRVYIGGVWVSEDGGENWSTTSGPAGQVWSLVVDPNNDLVAYAGTGDDGGVTYNGRVFRTVDGGKNWEPTPINQNQCIKSVAVDPNNGKNIWAIGGQCAKPTTDSTIYLSEDSGVIFTPKKTFYGSPTEVSQVVIDENGVVYAAGNGVYVSNNGGNSFSKPHTNGTSRMVIDPVSGQVHVDGYHTSNGKDWFSDTPSPLPGLFGIAPFNASLMFAPSGQGIQRTTDGGISWSEANTGIHEVLVTQVTADPYNQSVLYATSQNGLARSADNGATWKFPILVGGMARNSWAVAVHPVIPGIIYTGDGSNVWKSVDYGDTWNQSNLASSGGVFQMTIDPNDPKIVYATVATMSGDITKDGLYGTTDDGEHWSRVGLAGRQVNAVQAVKDTNSTTVYAGAGDMWSGSTTGGVFRKRAGETEWTQVGPMEAVVVDMAVDPRDPKHVYIGVGAMLQSNQPPYGVFESPDGGDNWTQVLTTTGSIFTLAIDPQNPDTLYAATMDRIYQSLNRGAKWEVYSQGGAATNIQSLFMPSLPPTPVTSFTAVAVDSVTNHLSWTNPLDVGFTDTMIRYSTVTYPATYNDGVLLTKRAAKPGSADSTDHNGVESGKTYYYSAFASDFLGRFSAPVKAKWPSNVHQSPIGAAAAAPILRSGTSVLYLSTGTGLYRRTVDDPSGFRIYLPLLLKAVP